MFQPASLQTIDRQSALLCLKVEKFCKANLNFANSPRLAIALSGGSDSTALTLIFHILAPRLKCSLCAIHINHHLRADAAADQKFSESLCSALNIPLHTYDLDVPGIVRQKTVGIEEAGHIGRMKIFKNFIQSGSAQRVLLGHQADDLCEDIFMRLIRGSGWPALGGMKALEFFLFRPLLQIDSATLKSFLRRLGQDWREDASNASLEFRRNRVRHLLLPLARAENPALTTAAVNLHHLAQLDEDYWQRELDQFMKNNPFREQESEAGLEISISREPLVALHPAGRLRLYHRILKYINSRLRSENMAPARADSLFRLDMAVTTGPSGKCFQFPGGISVTCARNRILFNSPR